MIPKVLSLFSGIGGIDLGLQRAGMRIAGQIEIDPFCNSVLEKHWPKIWRKKDVRSVTANHVLESIGRPDILAGGFPCQDVSDAGYRAGIEGTRSKLWTEFLRLIRSILPPFVLIENVDGLRRRGGQIVFGDLAACGYDAEWAMFGACDVGAPHVRERIFILAYLAGFRFKNDPAFEIVRLAPGILEEAERWASPRANFSGDVSVCGKRLPHARLLRMDDGIPSRLDVCRIAALGNAVVPQITELIGEVMMQRLALIP